MESHYGERWLKSTFSYPLARGRTISSRSSQLRWYNGHHSDRAAKLVTLGETGRHMCEGEFESLKAIYAFSPAFVPKPYAWGKYTKGGPGRDILSPYGIPRCRRTGTFINIEEPQVNG